MVLCISKATALLLALVCATTTSSASASSIRASRQLKHDKAGKAGKTTPEVTLRVSTLTGLYRGTKSAKASKDKLPRTDDNGCFEPDGLVYNIEITVKPMAEEPGAFCAEAEDAGVDDSFQPQWIQLYSEEFICDNPDCTSCFLGEYTKIIKYDKWSGKNPGNMCWYEEYNVCFNAESEPMRLLESNNDPAMVDQYYKNLAEHSCLGDYLF